MDENVRKLEDQLVSGRITRREFMKRALALGVGLPLASAIVAACGGAAAPTAAPPTAAPQPTSPPPAAKAKVVWVSPRGTLEVMDDYNLWVATKLGYFDQQNLQVELQPGPLGGANVVSLVTEGKADISYPSPGVITASLDAGIPVILAWEMFNSQVFDFAIPADSNITSVKDLAGKTIALGSTGWTPIVDPILVEAGVDPKSVKYVEAGQQWGQMVDQKKADAALAWEGLRAQWLSVGLKVKFLIGSEFSKHPSNGYTIRAADLNDSKWVDIWTRFFRAVAMGLEFGRLNPQAAGEITYTQFPALKDQMTPALALESMRQLAYGYNEGVRLSKGYGYADEAKWASYLDTVFKLGQTKKQLKSGDVVTNKFIADANSFDKDKVATDAKNYPVSDAWKNLKLQGPI
jgi:NitT/TauT family transport system substrate-binding protein